MTTSCSISVKNEAKHDEAKNDRMMLHGRSIMEANRKSEKRFVDSLFFATLVPIDYHTLQA